MSVLTRADINVTEKLDFISLDPFDSREEMSSSFFSHSQTNEMKSKILRSLFCASVQGMNSIRSE